MEKIDEKLNEVSGGAAVKMMLICSACKYSVDPEKITVQILPGEVVECPKCHQVAMTLKKV